MDLELYVVNFTHYADPYGAIGGVIVLLLWLYISGLALLAGAELNAEIEHAALEGKAPGEKRPGEKTKIGRLAIQFASVCRRLSRPGSLDMPVGR